MPSSILFALNADARVFGLSTAGTKWREFPYLGLEFKQLSAVPHFLWAVGSDRQIYLHVHGLDTPIRVKEESYENERWTPISGFSSRLLPTDRHHFSNHDGSQEKSLSKIRLPSMAWQWEGAWHLELTLNGQPLDHDGWTYAVDFPATYYPTKQWTSCVRRRKWVRYRRYTALNSWCAIAPLHKDATKEPFIWISIGCNEFGEKMTVWAVTALGRVMFRTEVSTTTPEGRTWRSVNLPPGCEINQISAGGNHLVWAVTNTGSALVRTAMTRDCIIGDDWIEVAAPEGRHITQVAVGSVCVWALTKDSCVWFRTGMKNELTGTSWVEIPGSMSAISLSSNDQLFAIGSEDRLLYFRTGITEETPSGQTWRRVCAPTQLSRTSSVASMFQTAGSLNHVGNKEKRHRSWTSLNRYSGSHEGAKLDFELEAEGACHSAPVMTRGIHANRHLVEGGSLGSSGSSGFSSNVYENRESSYLPLQSEIIESRPKSDEPNDTYDNSSHPVFALSNNKQPEMSIKKSVHAWSPVRSVGSVVATEAHSEADSSVFDSDLFTGVYGEVGEREEADDYLYWADSEAYWCWVEAGACTILPDHPPNWFSENSSSTNFNLDRSWRVNILNELKRRLPDDLDTEKFQKAVETCSWIKSVSVKSQADGDTAYSIPTNLEVEWVESEQLDSDFLGDDKETSKDFGTITLSNSENGETLFQFNINELVAAIRCSNPGFPRMKLIKGPELYSIGLQFSVEDELEEWLTELNEMACKVRNIAGAPSPHSLWLSTSLGDIYVLDSSYILSESQRDSGGLLSLHLPTVSQTTPFHLPLPNGLPKDYIVTIYGLVHENADRFSINLMNGTSANCDYMLHFNPRISDNVVVENARRNGLWGPETLKDLPFVPGQIFVVEITSCENSFNIVVNGLDFSNFQFRDENRLTSSFVTHVGFNGDVSITKIIYKSSSLILHPPNLFFRKIPGHLKKIESAGGITWGLGFNKTPWIYIGGQTEESNMKNAMVDTHAYYVYENQRWNPLTGYTTHGLPTDRHMWSDVTGRFRRTKEGTRLLSPKWQWIADWEIDMTTPGGTDDHGWQYAVDFPSAYHGKKHLTDYVRRRRWVRKARLVTAGPWLELGHTPLLDCSLHLEEDGRVVGWGVAINGDVLFRIGLDKGCPMGISWEHVQCEQPLVGISSAPGQVWGLYKGGGACWRYGISASNPMGTTWENIDAPKGAGFQMISVGKSGVWGLDTSGKLSVRQEVSNVFPSGSHWLTLPLEPDSGCQDIEVLPSTPSACLPGGFRHVSSGSNLWAISSSGRLLLRININPKSPAGTAWSYHFSAPWFHACGW